MSLRFLAVTFRHPGAPEPLFRELCLQLPRGWSGVVGPNGAGKTTFLLLALGRLAPPACVRGTPLPRRGWPGKRGSLAGALPRVKPESLRIARASSRWLQSPSDNAGRGGTDSEQPRRRAPGSAQHL